MTLNDFSRVSKVSDSLLDAIKNIKINEQGEEGTIPNVTVAVNLAYAPNTLLSRQLQDGVLGSGFSYLAVAEQTSSGQYLCYEVVASRESGTFWYTSKATRRYVDLQDRATMWHPITLASIPLDIKGAVIAAFAEKGIVLT